MNCTKPQKKKINPFVLKLLFISLVATVGTLWPIFPKLPTWPFTQLSILWVMCLYRPLNKNNKTRSILKQFMMGFWFRLGWTISYNLYNTHTIQGSIPLMSFISIILQALIACTIYVSMPVQWLQKLWNIRYARWFILVIDQAMGNGLYFITLFTTEFITKQYPSLIIPILVISCRSIARPMSLIISSHFNKNLTKPRLIRWLKIAGLNIARTLFLAMVNDLVLKYSFDKQEQKSEYYDTKLIQDGLQYFNFCYFGYIGYLMYLQTYTL